jgi:hypothetical protein
MLPDGALIDERTRSRLGEDAMQEVLASLWPGDCQTCGQSLGSTPPALLVDDLGILTKASLHHRACRAPAWNDGLVIMTSSAELLTWRTVVLLLLPFGIRGGKSATLGCWSIPAWKKYGWGVTAMGGTRVSTQGSLPRD